MELCRDANLELRMQIVHLQQDVGVLETQLRNAQDKIRAFDVSMNLQFLTTIILYNSAITFYI